MSEERTTILGRAKSLITGQARSVHDKTIFHKISLAAFLAWVGLGSDGLSSSCYGPSEAFASLHAHPYLGVIVALATAITIFVISASYSQIVELFPTGGGGYLVASKLLSPQMGAISGCALLVDYVLTITLSIASGTDALFSSSFVPPDWQKYKLTFAVGVIVVMTILNIRGVKESVAPLVPIFLLFLLTHGFIIVYTMVVKMGNVSDLPQRTVQDVRSTTSEMGVFGMLFLIMHSYSMGAGTFTGIEAVSNGMPILRDPKVHTAKKTMRLMSISLAAMAMGLMLTYLLWETKPHPTKTLNAVMLELATGHWPAWLGDLFVNVTLFTEAMLLCIAAQTGFLDAPRIMANMALDRWLPTRLSLLSDRLVTSNGVIIITVAAAILMIGSNGSVDLLIVLYSINVFITFSISQTGMVRHWWQERGKGKWLHGLIINGSGLMMTVLILVWVIVAKFFVGGWVTLVITGGLVAIVNLIRRHYANVSKGIAQFNQLAEAILKSAQEKEATTPVKEVAFDPSARTAVVLVGGFNGLGLHSTQNVIRYFGDCFRNFVFISAGIVDAGNFKGADEVHNLEEHIREECNRYVDLMRREGYYSEAYTSVGTDIADEIAKLSPQIIKKFPQSIFFAGQLIFADESFLTRLLHNNIVFAIQKRLYRQGIPFQVMPFRV